MHTSPVLATNAVFVDDPDMGLLRTPLSSIIPCAIRVENTSAVVVIVYKEGITGSHFVVGGIERIMIPFYESLSLPHVIQLDSSGLRQTHLDSSGLGA